MAKKRGSREEKPLDPNWTIHNDRQSVTVGINTRLWLCAKQGLQPTLIRLGREHTRLFLREHALDAVPRGPVKTPANYLVWDGEHTCYASRTLIPIKFNDPKIIGIAVEGVPKGKR